jgi:hypothetical protein
MRTLIVLYDTVTGAITGNGVIDSAVLDKTEAGLSGNTALLIVTESKNSTLFFVDLSGENPAVVNKTAATFTADKTTMTANGVDEITITNLPDCLASYGGTTVEIIDGELVITADLVGSYFVKFSGVPYLDTLFYFTAV